jgi:type II secretory pathway pseudopilin PulG
MDFFFFLVIIIVAVILLNAQKQKAEQQRKAATAKAAFEQRAAQNRKQESSSYERPTAWGTLPYDAPMETGEGGSKSSDPFCQGPAGKAVSTEGVGDAEGMGDAEGTGDAEGESFAALSTLKKQIVPATSSLTRVRPKAVTFDAHAEPPEQAAPNVKLTFNREAAIQGILYAEILGKPKALRRG